MRTYTQKSCTLSAITNVKAIYTYYYLSNTSMDSNIAPKNKSSTSEGNPPDENHSAGHREVNVSYNGQIYKWVDVEPSLNIVNNVIQNEAIGQLYVIECVKFTDNTFNWGPMLTSSTYAASKAAYNLAHQAKQVTELMGGHFIYKGTDTTKTIDGQSVVTTPAGAGVIRTLNDDPANWGFNTWIGSNGIQLRNGENVLSEWTNSGLSLFNSIDSLPIAQFKNIITIGKPNKSRAEIDIQSFKMYFGDEENPYVCFEDSRDIDTGVFERHETRKIESDSDYHLFYAFFRTDNAIFDITSTTLIKDFYGDGVVTNFTLELFPLNIINVSISDGIRWEEKEQGTDYLLEDRTIKFFQAPASIIRVTYTINTNCCAVENEYPNIIHFKINSSDTTYVKDIDDTNASIIYNTDDPIRTYTLGTRKDGWGVGNYSYAEGKDVIASGDYSHAEGYETTASANYSHSEGHSTESRGRFSHAEGDGTTASGYSSHAEGDGTTASGYSSHAEGLGTSANGSACHAEGTNTTANNGHSHAEGDGSEALGTTSHAEGCETKAYGAYSHAQNLGTEVYYDSQTAIGQYNNNKSTNVFEIGWGTESTPKNIFEVDKNGNLECANVGVAVSKTSDFKVTRSTGTSCTVNSVRKSGNVMMVSLGIATGSNGYTPSSPVTNLYTGTIGSNTGASYNPAQTTTGIGYINNVGVVGQITIGGELIVRPLGTLPASKTVYIYFTYFM